MQRSIWLVVTMLILQILLSPLTIAQAKTVEQSLIEDSSFELTDKESTNLNELEEEQPTEEQVDDQKNEEASTEESDLPTVEGQEAIEESPVEEDREDVSTEIVEDSSSINHEEEPIEVELRAKWQMDGELIYAHANGEVEYEFAFRHVPIEGQEPIDLEEATFYFNLPKNAVYRSSTFWGVYEPENHRVVWQNIGGITTEHANFDPQTPRRVNVQIDYVNPAEEVTVSMNASYTPKGMEQRWTNDAVITHTFEEDVVEWQDGIHIDGQLEERPGVPEGYPLLTGQHFTYNVFYSLNSLQPYRYGQLFVQLPGTIQFNKHVQLTGDFKDYYYDAERHRFVFNFKDEITKARGVMRINNLVFPNYVTPNGTRSELNMQYIYNKDTVHGIEPDVLVAQAVSNWKVTHELVEESAVAKDDFSYRLHVKNQNETDFGQLSHTAMTVVDRLPKEATFVEAYYDIAGERKAAKYDAETHSVQFDLGNWNSLDQYELFVTVRYEEPTERKVRHAVELSYVPLEESVRTMTHYFRYDVEAKQASISKFEVPVRVQALSGRPLSKVEFELRQEDQIVASEQADSEGLIRFEVEAGQYTLHLVDPNQMWRKIEPISLNIAKDVDEIVITLRRYFIDSGANPPPERPGSGGSPSEPETPGTETPGGSLPSEPETPGTETPGGSSPSEPETPGTETPGGSSPSEPEIPGTETPGGSSPSEPETPGTETPGGSSPSEPETPGAETPGGSSPSEPETPGAETPGGSSPSEPETPGTETPGGSSPSEPEIPGSGGSSEEESLKDDPQPTPPSEEKPEEPVENDTSPESPTVPSPEIPEEDEAPSEEGPELELPVDEDTSIGGQKPDGENVESLPNRPTMPKDEESEQSKSQKDSPSPTHDREGLIESLPQTGEWIYSIMMKVGISLIILGLFLTYSRKKYNV